MDQNSVLQLLKTQFKIQTLILPWHIISIFEEKPNPETNIIYSAEFAHCAEMRATRPSDTQQMLDVRARIVSFISKCLNQCLKIKQ